MTAAALPVCAAVFVSFALNLMRFGNPLYSGYEPAFSFGGFKAFLISPSGALLLFAPASVAGVGLLPLARRHRLASLYLSVALVMIVFYGSLDDWLGTRSYGPRYLVPILPVLVAPLAVWLGAARRPTARGARIALVALCVLSVLVQFPAVAVDFSRVGIAAGQPPQRVRRDQWRWCPMWLNAKAITGAAVSTAAALVSNRRAPVGRRAGEGSLAARLPFGLDFWWVHLFQLRAVSRAVAVLAALIPLAIAGGLAARAWRYAAPARAQWAGSDAIVLVRANPGDREAAH